MKKSTMVYWFIAAVLMIVGGIVCFCLPIDTTLTTLAYIIGALVLAAGIVELAAYFSYGMHVLGGGAFLADGIITVLLGVLLLANEGIVAGFLPFIFGMWFIIEGISTFSLSITGTTLAIPYSWTIMLLSIIEIIFGFVSFLNPVAGAISLTALIGIFLLVQGVSMLSDWAVILRAKKYVGYINKDGAEIK